jgi:predicted nucleic acid-binding protein
VILVDTSVWVDHLRRGDADLARRLEDGEVLAHRLVVEELACGAMRRRAEILGLLEALPKAPEAEHGEFLAFVERRGLAGVGLGAVDAHLLASAALARARLWTRDAALARAAARLGVGLDRDARA